MKELKGLFKCNGIMLVSKAKRYLARKDEEITENTEYYMELGFVGKINGTDEILVLTAGKAWDTPELETFRFYNLGLNYVDKKLRIVDYERIDPPEASAEPAGRKTETGKQVRG